jgi:hypothetical protein
VYSNNSDWERARDEESLEGENGSGARGAQQGGHRPRWGREDPGAQAAQSQPETEELRESPPQAGSANEQTPNRPAQAEESGDEKACRQSETSSTVNKS